MRKVVNSLEDYYSCSFVPISEITSKMLKQCETYLRGERTITRLNQFKRPVKSAVKGMGDYGIHNHMRDMRLLFNDVKAHYNDEEKEIGRDTCRERVCQYVESKVVDVSIKNKHNE